MTMFYTKAELEILRRVRKGRETKEDDLLHASDCALHNAPALPVGPCDCGAISNQES